MNRNCNHAGLTPSDILHWLREENPQRLQQLWRMADETRRAHVGDAVHLRGLIEISNHCVRRCAYCGLRAGNRGLARYRMTPDEIFAAAQQALRFGYGSVVLQAGEDFGLTTEAIAALVRRVKAETPLAVTLSLGERSHEELAMWRAAGADRYLLRFETSDQALFDAIHPGLHGDPADRIAILKKLKNLGYETGSGIMIGLPGQSYESVARDICLFRELDLDMIGIGPYIPHPQTPLGKGKLNAETLASDDPSRSADLQSAVSQNCILRALLTFDGSSRSNAPDSSGKEQVPNTELMVYKALALTRLVRPDANIPSTSALATINKYNGRELGLQRGANVLMPNLTPLRYRRLYEIYPAKACIDETGDACSSCLRLRIAALGRHVGQGPGGRKLARNSELGLLSGSEFRPSDFSPCPLN